MTATYTRCDSDEALEALTARFAERGQVLSWAWNDEERQYEARLLGEHGRVIEVAYLVVEVTAAAQAAVAAASGSAA